MQTNLAKAAKILHQAGKLAVPKLLTAEEFGVYAEKAVKWATSVDPKFLVTGKGAAMEAGHNALTEAMTKSVVQKVDAGMLALLKKANEDGGVQMEVTLPAHAEVGGFKVKAVDSVVFNPGVALKAGDEVSVSWTMDGLNKKVQEKAVSAGQAMEVGHFMGMDVVADDAVPESAMVVWHPDGSFQVVDLPTDKVQDAAGKEASVGTDATKPLKLFGVAHWPPAGVVFNRAVLFSKWGGSCPLCGAFFPAGMPIAWRKGEGAMHLHCWLREGISAIAGQASQPTLQALLTAKIKAEQLALATLRWYKEAKPSTTTCADGGGAAPEFHAWGCDCPQAAWAGIDLAETDPTTLTT